MSLIGNAANVAYSTAFPTDKLVRVFTGSYAGSGTTLRGGSVYIHTIPHNLGRPVFCELLHSDNGGTTYADGGMSASGGVPRLAFSDSTNVYIFHGYSNTGTVHYKVYATWIDDYDTSNPLVSIQNYSDVPTQFDSRKNYQKIAVQQTLNFSGTGSSSQAVTHGLGYTPNAKLYFEAFGGEVWPANAGGATNNFLYDFVNQDECALSISTSLLTVSMDKQSATSRRAWLRGYYDR